MGHVYNFVDMVMMYEVAIDALFGVSTGSRQPRQED
jgi:hypothetical protein